MSRFAEESIVHDMPDIASNSSAAYKNTATSINRILSPNISADQKTNPYEVLLSAFFRKP